MTKKKLATKKKNNEVVKTLSWYIERSRSYVCEAIVEAYPAAVSTTEIMEKFQTDEACFEFLDALPEEHKNVVCSPDNMIYDVLRKNTIRGYIEFCIMHLFDTHLQKTEVCETI